MSSTHISKRVQNLLSIFVLKFQRGVLFLDYSIVEININCPKCKSTTLICFHGHTAGQGPKTGRDYDYDECIHVCPNCDYKEEKMEDTPISTEGYSRPNNCLICGRSLIDPERVYNEQ